jgi:hypothetical protein
MKIDHTGKSPSGNRVLTLRLGVEELQIIKGLLKTARAHTPHTPTTRTMMARMKSMAACFDSALVAQWMEHGDSTSDNAGSIPAEGAILGAVSV